MSGAAGAVPGITVTGSASVQVVPDVVTAVLGAHVRAEDVQEAFDRAGAALSALRDSLVAGGCAEADLRTEATTTWREEAREGRPGAVVVRLTLRALIRDVAAAGEQVRLALAAAGDAAQLDSLTFGVSDPAAAVREAREAAFADARATAEQYAALADQALGAVVEVVDDGEGAPPTPRPLRARAVAMEAALPVDAGEQTVTARVRVRWAWATAGR